MKKVIAIIVAIALAILLFKVLIWILKVTFFATLGIMSVIAVLVIAVPIYLVIQKALTK